ncbi:hypothetical protein [Lacticaseibacillus nasuensis]|uniref:Uncharacterized protein n=1 Tax=Lacticaseibacillus nasuensis JCM 17158 TaxID=1291734 RepID=A0A0R1JMH1_9LACO|nr:hypothetical protein [Lacticaseibacillus nasuensis]KRK72646.1 hypothetical protein FD02_GL001619 [Lacticaseibacillus nasuensis JCM 17158]
MNEKESHERQVAFLQAHEAQITRFIQTKEASTVAKVEYNWRTVAAQSSMVYEYPYLAVDVTCYNNKHKQIDCYRMSIHPDNVDHPTAILNIDGIDVD